MYQFRAFSTTEAMKRGFLLADGKQLNVTAVDKESMKKIQVSKTVLDEKLGVSMVQLDTDGMMDVNVKVDEKGNITFETKPSER